MMIAEKDAKTKWCPMARYLAEGLVSGKLVSISAVNRGRAGERVGECLGSGCMMWRWDEREFALTNKGHGLIAAGAPKDEIDREKVFTGDDRKGHCGLSGAIIHV